ncbi:MAG TPA: SDR family NAD(P)-dependent oxidoreductase, partial [Rubrivivax sp.]|nr:SDR family NAD(P)-dependent oxidoreductase [Rubrivivax sp.]
MNRTLLVTGGGRGIGAATALRAARLGYDIALNFSRDQTAATALADRIRATTGRRAALLQADVGDEAAVLAMFATLDGWIAQEGWPPLAGLVNNAGVVDLAARVDEMAGDRLRRMFNINVLGSLYCAREALLRMSRRHGGGGGAIVNLSSVAAVLGAPGQYVDYAASKGAIDTFTVGLAREVAAEGVRVNAVRPGIIETDIHASGGQPDRAQRMAPLVPMQRAGSADEVAAAIV